MLLDIEVHQASVELLDDEAGRREADLRGRLDAESPLETEVGDDEDSESLDSTDYQLARAIDLLRGIALFEARTTTRG